MLPVATPPNAIAFSSGRITIAQMVRAGFWLNLFGIGVVLTLNYAITSWLFVP
jgi:sodium-dependent dicarboxylate transporter 2/3/5